VTSPHANTITPGMARAFGDLERAGTILADYMTPDQLARELGICKRTLDRWQARRSGPPRVTVGRRPLYRREAVAQWLRKREERSHIPEGARHRAR
jgi:hypothetical protein